MLPFDYPIFAPPSVNYSFTSRTAHDQRQALQDDLQCCSAPSLHDANSAKKNMKPEKIKSEMCSIWLELGYCTRRECWFAHGHQDLRSVERPRRYKTRTCLRFTETGQCPYGQRCSWLHPADVPRVVHNDQLNRSCSPPSPVAVLTSGATLSQASTALATVKMPPVTPSFSRSTSPSQLIMSKTSKQVHATKSTVKPAAATPLLNEKYGYVNTPSSMLEPVPVPPVVLMQAAFVDMNCQHKRKLRERASNQALEQEIRSIRHRLMI